MPSRQITSRYPASRPFNVGGDGDEVTEVRTIARFAGLPAGSKLHVTGNVDEAMHAGFIERLDDPDRSPVDDNAPPAARAVRRAARASTAKKATAKRTTKAAK